MSQHILPIFGHWLLAIGYWLLPIGYWLLVRDLKQPWIWYHWDWQGWVWRRWPRPRRSMCWSITHTKRTSQMKSYSSKLWTALMCWHRLLVVTMRKRPSNNSSPTWRRWCILNSRRISVNRATNALCAKRLQKSASFAEAASHTRTGDELYKIQFVTKPQNIKSSLPIDPEI